VHDWTTLQSVENTSRIDTRQPKLGLLLALLTVAALGLGVAPRGYGQKEVRVVGPTGEIPRDHYKTWSLFLVCNPEWLSPERSQDLSSLYTQFQNFGRTIGDDNVAVWFWKSEPSPDDPKLAGNVDVERSVRFCKAFQLKPSSSPHVLITSSYPEGRGPLKDLAVLELANMSPADVTKLLAKLTDQLLLQGRVTTDAVSKPQEELWIRLLEATQQTINKFGCAWSFKIQTGVLSADLRSCQTP
jgi:hypothetical protein